MHNVPQTYTFETHQSHRKESWKNAQAQNSGCRLIEPKILEILEVANAIKESSLSFEIKNAFVSAYALTIQKLSYRKRDHQVAVLSVRNNYTRITSNPKRKKFESLPGVVALKVVGLALESAKPAPAWELKMITVPCCEPGDFKARIKQIKTLFAKCTPSIKPIVIATHETNKDQYPHSHILVWVPPCKAKTRRERALRIHLHDFLVSFNPTHFGKTGRQVHKQAVSQTGTGLPSNWVTISDKQTDRITGETGIQKQLNYILKDQIECLNAPIANYLEENKEIIFVSPELLVSARALWERERQVGTNRKAEDEMGESETSCARNPSVATDDAVAARSVGYVQHPNDEPSGCFKAPVEKAHPRSRTAMLYEGRGMIFPGWPNLGRAKGCRWFFPLPAEKQPYRTSRNIKPAYSGPT